MKVYNILKEFSIFIGFMYCLFILWNYLLRKRIERDLLSDYTYSLLILYIFLFILFLTLVILNIRIVFYKANSGKFLEKILKISPINLVCEFLMMYILNAPLNFYAWLYARVKIKTVCNYITEFIYIKEIYHKKFLLYILLFIMYIIPAISSLIFLWEITVFNKFVLFFKFVPFLLIPLFFRIFLFIVRDFSEKNKLKIEEWINFEANNEKTGFIMSLQSQYENDPDFTDEVMDYHAFHWYNYLFSLMTIDEYKMLENKIRPYVYLCIYSSYCVGWGFLLYKILSS